MNEIYIKVGKDNVVTLLHRWALDAKHGLGKTREELEKEGFFYTGDEPKPEMIEGRVPVLKYNPSKKELYYEYKVRPVSDTERIDAVENLINEAIKAGKL